MKLHAPVEDWLFILTRLLRVQDRTDLPGFEAMTEDVIADLLRESARFTEDVLFDVCAAGDREGAHLEDGVVRTPVGFREALRRTADAGWHSIGIPAELGGGGVPSVISAAVQQMRGPIAHSFGMYASFCGSAALVLDKAGEPWMREVIIPRLVAADWTATMCMTEAHTGSDLRRLTTRAVQQDDGTWRITGEKIFISGGDHDLTDNIVHIVLAKVPAADGTVTDTLEDVNVFLVSKRHVDPETGELGGPNDVSVLGIEHKMGIEASATCQLRFDGAVGWRLSVPGAKGSTANMAPMFVMMNTARVGVALNGVGYAHLAYANALDYARDRLSGRGPAGPVHPELPADPIVVHPDVRRLLLGASSFAQGGRALCAQVALWQTESQVASTGQSPTGQTSTSQSPADLRALAELFRPVLKAYCTDKGFESAVNCQQVLGGHGYTRDYGLEQWVRNARIGQIYEGANGIQARDFVRRCVQGKDARSLELFFGLAEDMVARHPAGDVVADLVEPFRTALVSVRKAVETVQSADAMTGAAAAYDLLTAFGVLGVAWMWLRTLEVLDEGGVAEATAREKRRLARFWISRELPLVAAYVDRVEHLATELVEVDPFD